MDAIFSATLKGRHPYKIADWGGIGLRWGWENRAISLYGRNSASGTYGYFKKVALFKGDYKKIASRSNPVLSFCGAKCGGG